MTSRPSRRVCVLARHGGGENPLYAPWLPLVDADITIVRDYDEGWRPSPDVDLVVTAQHYEYPELGILHRLMEDGRVGVLILSDGILEYRNIWEHPSAAVASLFQPVLGHKLACIGRSQARQVEAWGNLGKCEVVGLPRLDTMLHRKPRTRQASEPLRLLVTTARTPAFSDHQYECVIRSMHDLMAWAENNSVIGRTSVEVVWRLTGALSDDLGVSSEPEFAANALAWALERVDAMVSTPSTCILEGLLQGVPVATLDYTGVPPFVPTAWHIGSADQVEPCLRDLLDPPPPKLLYQDVSLHDGLECHTPAAPRMVELIEGMLDACCEARAQGAPVSFPDRILHDPQDGHHLPEQRFELSALYPDHPVFGEPERSRLQVEVAQLRQQVSAERIAELEGKAGERDFWKEKYERLAGIFPLRVLLALRREIKGRYAWQKRKDA